MSHLLTLHLCHGYVNQKQKHFYGSLISLSRPGKFSWYLTLHSHFINIILLKYDDWGKWTETVGFYIIIHFLSHVYIFCMYCVLFTLHRGAHHQSELLTRTEPSRTSLSRTDHCVSLTEGEIEYICMNFWYKRH